MGNRAAESVPPATAPVVVPPPNWNYADKKTRNKAAELGLDLEEFALKRLARQPMKEAMSILEAAAWVASNNQDPNEFVHSELIQLEGDEASASNAAPEYAERATGRHSTYGQAHRQHQGYDDGYRRGQHQEGKRRAGGSHQEGPPKRT